MTSIDTLRFALSVVLLCSMPGAGCRSHAPTQGSPDNVPATHRPQVADDAARQVDAISVQASALRARPLVDDQLVFPERPPTKPIPFILFLHGFGSSGANLKQALLLSRVAEQYGIAYAAPSGPADSQGRRFWNADGCCDFEHSGVDHTRALLDLLHRAATDPRIDAARLYAYGFSNGGYMAHQLACAPATPLAGIVSVAGAPPTREQTCRPEKSLVIVQVHGDQDAVVPFSGGYLLGEPNYPRVESIMTGLGRWAAALGCPERHPGQSTTLDLLSEVPGRETTRSLWTGCRGVLGLFLVKGGTHSSVTAMPVQVSALTTMLGREATR
jgi:polyhydroxybutyrate depolymerase